MGGYLGIFGPPPGQSAVIFGAAVDVVDALVDLEFRKCALSLSPKVPCGNASRFRHYLISAAFSEDSYSYLWEKEKPQPIYGQISIVVPPRSRMLLLLSAVP